MIVQSPIIIFHPTVGSGHVLAGPRDSSNQSAGKKPFQTKDQAALHFPISYLLVTDRAYHVNPAWDSDPLPYPTSRAGKRRVRGYVRSDSAGYFIGKR